MIQWYHASFNSSSQQTWTFPVPYTSKDSLAILPTNWANSNNTSPLQYKMFQKVIDSNNKCTGIKFMSLNGGEHDFLAIGY